LFFNLILLWYIFIRHSTQHSRKILDTVATVLYERAAYSEMLTKAYQNVKFVSN